MIKAFFTKKENIIFLTIAFLIIAVFTILNFRVPIYFDDWAFYVGYGQNRITSFKELLPVFKVLYLEVDGRNVIHFIEMFFVIVGKNIFNIFNTGAVLLLIVLIYFLVATSRKIRPLWFLGIFILVWFALPVPRETLLWQSGAIAYLWTSVISLSFLILLKKYFYSQEQIVTFKIITLLCCFVLGVVIGNLHETMSVILFIMTVSCLVYKYKFYNKLRMDWLIINLGILIGLIIQYGSPGNYIKFYTTSQYVQCLQFIQRPAFIISQIIKYQGLLVAIVGGILFWYFINKFLLENKKQIIDFMMWVFLANAIVLNCSAILFPYFPPRAFFFSSIFFMLFIVRFLMFKELEYIKKWSIVLIIPLLLLSIKNTIIQSKNLYEKYVDRDLEIRRQISSGKTIIQIEKIRNSNNEMLIKDILLPRPSSNIWISRYYGVKNVEVKR